MSTPYENVKNWILNSGIVITDPKNENYGAVHSFYDQNKQNFGYLYPEITGYNLSALCFLHRIEKTDLYIRMAKSSAIWLIRTFDKYGAIIQGLDDENRSRQQFAYSFDTAICAKGLLDCYQITKEEQFLDYAKKLVEWLNRSITNNGTILPFLELKSNKFRESNEVWYKKSGCLHIKVSIPFVDLYQITQDSNYLDTAIKICNKFSQFQNKDGSYSIHENVKTINLHTMSYALEGLFYIFSVTKNKEYLQSIEKSLDWCTNQIEDDGSIQLWINSKFKSKAVYPIAQIIRLMILLDKFHNNDKYLKNILKLHSFMINLQAKNSHKKVNGGFYEEYYKSLFSWKKRDKLNSWGSLFALQALYWFDNYGKINFDESIFQLF